MTKFKQSPEGLLLNLSRPNCLQVGIGAIAEGELLLPLSFIDFATLLVIEFLAKS